MNLADAIRKASQTSESSGYPYADQAAHAVGPNHIFGTRSKSELPSMGVAQSRTASQDSTKPKLSSSIEIFSNSHRGLDSDVSGETTLVRLELDLAHDQLNALMKGIASSQQSVLTLREAAQFLRIPAKKLQLLAAEKAVPGMLVNGTWRFSRAALEQWLTG